MIMTCSFHYKLAFCLVNSSFRYDNTFCQAPASSKEVQDDFIDFSKAFDRMWHAFLFAKLEASSVSRTFILGWQIISPMYREQRNVTPGAVSEWFYINDIIHDNGSNIRLFTDGISLFIIENDPVTAAGCMKIDVGKIAR